ncbi:hypothetical protein ADN00_13015 [Ornatilinea apprima]|uniref:Uncharacterized protein n=1 Tax=Ornatilinea apprima TaxID=1134406 RepID=A0A0N8GMH4_9CHLR|nr:hypothetical protein [Ornatilinea apprima]KPL75306.1 hypothetical protein ADN00_13015 [Ornatilinea apprima]
MEKALNIPEFGLQPQPTNEHFNQDSWEQIKNKFQLDTSVYCWQFKWQGTMITPVSLGNLSIKEHLLRKLCSNSQSAYYEDAGARLLDAAKTPALQKNTKLLSPSIHKLLFFSPFLLETWYENENWLPDHKKGKNPLEFGLILYRLSEIFLSALAIQAHRQVGDLPEDLLLARILLIRLRFRLLAGLSQFSKLAAYLPDFALIVRNAQREYARLILERTDEVELALQLAIPPQSGWDLDEEINLILFSDDGQSRLWPFAQETPSDRLFTDTIIRAWMLPHDNLQGATASLVSLLHPNANHPSLINCLILSLRTLIFLSAASFILFLFFQNKYFLALPFIASGGGVIGLARLVFTRKLIIRQRTYPLALRIPAMGMVGLLIAAEFIEDLAKKMDHSSQNLTGLFISLSAVSLLFAYLYITSEISARLRFSQFKIQRALDLFSYGWAATFWLSTLAFFVYWRINNPETALLKFFSYPSLWLILLVLSSASLLVGVFTQIFWEDKAIAEPL